MGDISVHVENDEVFVQEKDIEIEIGIGHPKAPRADVVIPEQHGLIVAKVFRSSAAQPLGFVGFGFDHLDANGLSAGRFERRFGLARSHAKG